MSLQGEYPEVSCFLSEELMGSVSLTVMGKVGGSMSSQTPAVIPFWELLLFQTL